MPRAHSGETDYLKVARTLKVKRSMGQSFMLNREIAEFEAGYAKGMSVVEMGPGLGILTRELARVAKKVVAIEKDPSVFKILEGSIGRGNVQLVNDDFFSVDPGKIDADIMVSNIPYSLSSRVIYWISENRIPALVCVQKEFAEHMLARPGERSYSRLSVMCSLTLRVHKVRDVGAGNFYPRPKVDSVIIYIIPRNATISRDAANAVSAIMNHKRKRLKNAILDACESLRIGKGEALRIASSLPGHERRPMHMEPSEILDAAMAIAGHGK